MSAHTTGLAVVLAAAIAAIPGSALAHPESSSVPVRRALPDTAPLLLRTSDVPGLVRYSTGSGRISLWESAERESDQRAVLRETGWRSGARRTFGQSPMSLMGVLVIESRVFVFATPEGARNALPKLAPDGLQLVPGRLPVAGGSRLYVHQDTVAGVSELALSTQFRQRNVISRVMIVGTPGIITPAHLVATARRQVRRVAQALS